MLTRYRIPPYGYGLVESVQVERETAEYVFLPKAQFRRAHRGRNGNFFKTFEEAKAELLARLQRKLQVTDDERSRIIKRLQEARAQTTALQR